MALGGKDRELSQWRVGMAECLAKQRLVMWGRERAPHPLHAAPFFHSCFAASHRKALKRSVVCVRQRGRRRRNSSAGHTSASHPLHPPQL